MNFNLGELDDLFFNINDIITYIEGTKYQNRRFKLHLSNGDHLNFYIPNESIPHLLGINTTYLQSTMLFKSTNSFELLKEMINDSWRIYDSEKKGIISFKHLFSPYVYDKVNHFKENIKIDTNAVEFVCKYNKEKTYTLSDTFQKYDYIIVNRLENEKIGLLCLVRNQGYFAPMSNQVFDDFEKAKEALKNLLKFQEITLISGIETSNVYTDYYSSHNLTLQDKALKIENLKFYKNEFEATIDVANDFSYSISKLKQHRTTRNEDNALIGLIVQSIIEGKIIETDPYVSSNLLPIIDAFNDFICSNEFTNDESNKESYSELIKKLKHFEERIKNLTEKNEELTVKNTELEERNIAIEISNCEKEEKLVAIEKILKPRIN